MHDRPVEGAISVLFKLQRQMDLLHKEIEHSKVRVSSLNVVPQSPFQDEVSRPALYRGEARG
eukprot:3805279-Rhodomonas_salina.1